MSQTLQLNQEKAHSIADIRQNYQKYFSSIEEFHAFLAQFGIKWSEQRMSAGKASRIQDKILVQMSNALDHLIKVENELLERLRETYVLIDPSFSGTDKQLISNIIKEHEDLQNYAEYVQQTMNARKQLENKIKIKAAEVMQNFSAVVEPLIAAKLLAMAGSLKKLSQMTSSTLQLLGAEKALFRHLRNRRAKSPKYGLIYNSRHIQNMPRELRGKAARVLASKLMIAARIDFYSDRNEAEKLQKELAMEMKKICESGK